MEEAKTFGTKVLFIDEIHRFNKSQQDALLGAVENGTLILIGATTENPSFEVNAALLSQVTSVCFISIDAIEV
ncbi:MAG: AAA family ATPase [Chitinophagales bacterium]